jgi:enoyl-CoA hydratase/carnithine racemase
MPDLVLVEDDGPIRLIRINRPDKKNALTSAMYAALAEALAGADAAAGIGCVVIAGAPGAFCAGNDMADFLAAAQHGGGLSQSLLDFLHALARGKTPMVAAVTGVAVGIGTTMLLHCDYVVAGSDARFSTPFTSLGVVPEAASSLLGPRLMGHRRAFEIFAMGRPFGAEQAKNLGLVNAIAAPAEVEAEALKVAREIAALPREAVAISRALLRAPVEEMVARIDEEARIYRERLAAPEAKAAFERFFQRRK